MSSNTFIAPSIFHRTTLPTFSKSSITPIQPDMKLLDKCFTGNSSNINICNKTNQSDITNKVGLIRPL
jgi:hypothetical protein